jgi:hypothetical protein
MDKIVTRYGLPDEIISDRGGGFVCKMFSKLCKLLHVRKIHTTAYRPQGNGANERVHSTLYTLLRNLCQNKPEKWETHLPYALYAYNVQHHRSINKSPHEALYGCQPRLVQLDLNDTPTVHLDSRLQMMQDAHQASAATQKKTEEQRLQHQQKPLPDFNPGDHVKLALHVRHKMAPFWRGPYAVIKKSGPNTYQLEVAPTERFHANVHRRHLRPWYADDDAEQPDEPEVPIEQPTTSDPIPDEEISSESSEEDDEGITETTRQTTSAPTRAHIDRMPLAAPRPPTPTPRPANQLPARPVTRRHRQDNDVELIVPKFD